MGGFLSVPDSQTIQKWAPIFDNAHAMTLEFVAQLFGAIRATWKVNLIGGPHKVHFQV